MIHFHTRDKDSYDWESVHLTMPQLPCVGNFVLFESKWHKVEAVIHIPLEENSEYDAEVYAVRHEQAKFLNILDFHILKNFQLHHPIPKP